MEKCPECGSNLKSSYSKVWQQSTFGTYEKWEMVWVCGCSNLECDWWSWTFPSGAQAKPQDAT